jgi:hypothetical protein
MAKYEVTYRHIIERSVTSIVEADSEEEAIQKAVDGDCLYSDEDDAPEQGIEIKDEVANKLSDDYEV